MGLVVVGGSNRVVVSLVLCGAVRGRRGCVAVEQPALGPRRVSRSLSASLRDVASVLCRL